jgi:hypothetical protein
MSINFDRMLNIRGFGPEKKQVKKTVCDTLKRTGNDEADSKQELNAFQELAKASLAKETKSMADMFDTEHWVCLSFQSREQKDEFLAKSGLIAAGDKYLDGHKVAKIMDIQLTPAPKIIKENKPNKRWLEFIPKL